MASARQSEGGSEATSTLPAPGGDPAVTGPPGLTVSRDGVVTGNTYDKYGSANPVVRRLMGGFERTLDELLGRAAPGSVLDVGCGEGVLVHRWAQRLPSARSRRWRAWPNGTCSSPSRASRCGGS